MLCAMMFTFIYSKSNVRGWRLFTLIAAFYDCSDNLRPFVFKYFVDSSTDLNETHNCKLILYLYTAGFRLLQISIFLLY